MAAGSDITSDQNGETAAHAKSYSLFTQIMKWGTIVSFLVAALVVLIIAS